MKRLPWGGLRVFAADFCPPPPCVRVWWGAAGVWRGRGGVLVRGVGCCLAARFRLLERVYGAFGVVGVSGWSGVGAGSRVPGGGWPAVAGGWRVRAAWAVMPRRPGRPPGVTRRTRPRMAVVSAGWLPGFAGCADVEVRFFVAAALVADEVGGAEVQGVHRQLGICADGFGVVG